MPQFLAVVACTAVLVQGGYFPAFFLWAGVSLGIAILISRRELRCPRPLWFLLVLAGWYLLSSLVNGPAAPGLSQAALPLVCCLFALLCLSLEEGERRKLLVWVCRFGGGAAIAALLAFLGILPIPGSLTAQRLQFTFQYVNAAAVWFAAVLLLRGELHDPWVNRLSPFAAAALLLTRSAGGIGAYLVIQALVLLAQYGRKNWKAWVVSGAAVLVGAAAVATRFHQALGTFQERLVQSMDGLRGMLAAPLFGYGAGNWPQVKELFQSYDYRAQVVHNSYVQAGVEAGLPALLFLAVAVVLTLFLLKGSSPALKGAAILIPLHAVMDFTLCFFAVDALAIAAVALAAGKTGKPLPRWLARAAGAVCLVFFILLIVLRR